MEYEKILGIRPAFLSGEKYRLNLSWEDIIYENPGLCKIVGAKLSGPVLNDAEEVQSNDSIMLDFYRQYYIIAKNIYIAQLSWKKVNYTGEGTIILNDCTLSHDTELNKVPVLNKYDTVAIDTKGHDRETHSQFLAYNAYTLNSDGQVYNFS